MKKKSFINISRDQTINVKDLKSLLSQKLKVYNKYRSFNENKHKIKVNFYLFNQAEHCTI